MLGLFGYMIVALPMGIISGIFYAKTQERQFIVTWSMVARVPFFQVLEPRQIASIIEKLRSEGFAASRTILRKGDKGDRMYFLLDGEVEVDTAPGLVRRVPGEFFGERALVTNEPRSATVRAIGPVKLLSLAAADLNDVLDAHPQLLEHLRRAIETQTFPVQPAA
jgi:voltage-gated potassium channel